MLFNEHFVFFEELYTICISVVSFDFSGNPIGLITKCQNRKLQSKNSSPLICLGFAWMGLITKWLWESQKKKLQCKNSAPCHTFPPVQLAISIEPEWRRCQLAVSHAAHRINSFPLESDLTRMMIVAHLSLNLLLVLKQTKQTFWFEPINATASLGLALESASTRMNKNCL